MIIGITGLIGSGKGAVAEMLVEKGFEKLGHSGIISEELIKRGIEVTRDNQVAFANEMRRVHGSGYWARRLIEKIKQGKNYVVEGFRNLGEIEAFKERKDFVLIGVAAGRKRRYEWLLKRNRAGDPKNFQDFMKVESRDFFQFEEGGQQNALCFVSADHFVVNEGTLDELREQVDKLLDKLKIEC